MTPPPPAAADALLNALWLAGRNDVTLQELQRLSGMSGAQVHAALDALAAKGCRIERSPAGARLVTAGLACWADLLESAARRHGWRIGRRAKVFSKTTSTNDAAWQEAVTDDADGLVVLANHQTAGRGRLGHAWHAGANQSVLLSVLLCDIPGGSAAIDRLTLLCGLATAVGLERAVDEVQGAMPRIDIKWPNDLLAKGRKLAGILVETRRLDTRRGATDAVVVGIGINATQAAGDFPPDLGGRAISLYEAAGVMLDRLRVAQAVLASLHDHLLIENHEVWLAHWRQRCGMLGRHMTFRTGAHAITGRVLDVDPAQGLSVRDDQGVTHFLSARTCSVS